MKKKYIITLNSKVIFFLFALFVVLSITILMALDVYYDFGLGYSSADVKLGLIMIPVIFVIYTFIKIIDLALEMIGNLLP